MVKVPCGNCRNSLAQFLDSNDEKNFLKRAGDAEAARLLSKVTQSILEVFESPNLLNSNNTNGAKSSVISLLLTDQITRTAIAPMLN